MALARACRATGAKVTLIYGQIQTATPAGLVHSEQAVSAETMYQAVHRHIHEQDVFISVAAVADYKVKNSSNEKLKKKRQSAPGYRTGGKSGYSCIRCRLAFSTILRRLCCGKPSGFGICSGKTLRKT